MLFAVFVFNNDGVADYRNITVSTERLNTVSVDIACGFPLSAEIEFTVARRNVFVRVDDGNKRYVLARHFKGGGGINCAVLVHKAEEVVYFGKRG